MIGVHWPADERRRLAAEGTCMNARRLVTPLVVVAAVGGGAVAGAIIGIPGLSNAQESTTTTPTTDDAPKPDRLHVRVGGPEMEAAAKALGMSVDELMEKLSDGTTTIADVAEQENVDLDKVKDAMVEADRERIDDLVNNPLPKFDGRDGRGRHGGPFFGFGLRGPLGEDAEALARTLNLSVDELRTQLRDGKSLAEIAEAQGVDVQKVIDELVADANTRLDEAVKNGRLSQEKADELKKNLEAMITKMVNNELPKPFFGHGGPGAPDAPDAPDAPQAAPSAALSVLPSL